MPDAGPHGKLDFAARFFPLALAAAGLFSLLPCLDVFSSIGCRWLFG